MKYAGASAGKRPSDFDPEQLRQGAWVELEHTCALRKQCGVRSRRLAQRIAMDHLTEDPQYYRKLAKIHLDGIEIKSTKKALRYGSLVLAAVSFVRNDQPLGLVSYLLFGLSYIPRGR